MKGIEPLFYPEPSIQIKLEFTASNVFSNNEAVPSTVI